MTRITSYPELIRELFPRLAGGIRWGLDRTRRLLEAAGSPERRFATIHIGGTNGKGSCAATMASALHASGVRVGLYTSPHLCAFRERIQIDGAPIGEDALMAAAERVWPAVMREDPSFFEATTAIAMRALADAGVELAIIEVGLGGRLDATNVITPERVIITNIALDHAEFLGTSIESVAREKAGIMKPGVPVLTGEPDPRVRRLLRDYADAAGAPYAALPPEDIDAVAVSRGGTRFELATASWGELELATPLVGRYQAANAALAIRTLDGLPDAWRPSAEAVERGVASVYWPGRLQIEEVRGRTWALDVAHNPAGARALSTTLDELELPRPRIAIAGVLADKDWRGMLAPLARVVDRVIVTVPPSAPAHRRWDPDEVCAAMAASNLEPLASFDLALARAEELAAGRAGSAAVDGRGDAAANGAAHGEGNVDGGGSVVVTGSFHTVGDGLIALGRTPRGVVADPTIEHRAALPASATPA